jgi:hypothetical protein
MKMSDVLSRSIVGAAVILALLGASPVLAAGGAGAPGDTIHKGVDVWMTVAGFAQTSFADEPIPAGFFCQDSPAFTGTVVFKGAPLAIAPAKSLGPIDTVVRRLDNAAFDAKGEATTRVQLMALSLASVKPVDTGCGKYDVAVSLAGEQPVTTMKIFRTEAKGGTYSAPLALNVKAVFTPAAGAQGVRRELTRRIDLGPGSHSVWAYVQAPLYPTGVKVDTDGDGRPDAVLPASSNFIAGVSPAVLSGKAAQPRLAAVISGGGSTSPTPSCPAGQCLRQSCHCNPNSTDPNEAAGSCDSSHLHCVWVCVPAGSGLMSGDSMCLMVDHPADPTIDPGN